MSNARELAAVKPGFGAGDVSTNAVAGVDALTANTSGANNTAFGVDALKANTTASNNTAIGYQAGYSNTTGFGNVLVGGFAGYANQATNYQTVVGYGALQTSTAGSNTAVGTFSLNASTTGTRNTAVGASAGSLITTGSNNTILGGFTGNNFQLDIRTLNRYVVLSDGDGFPIYRGGHQRAHTLRANEGQGGYKQFMRNMSAGESNQTRTLFTVTNTSGNNRIYARVRFMAVSAINDNASAGVAYAILNANGLGGSVTSFSLENTNWGNASASLSWVSGALRFTTSRSTNYQRYLIDVDVIQHDGNALIVFEDIEENW